MAKPVIPASYERVELDPVSPQRLIEIIDWIMSSGVLGRGIIHENNNGIASGRKTLTTEQGHHFLWSLYRTGVETIMVAPNVPQPDYQAIFHFGDPRDAIEFKLLFG